MVELCIYHQQEEPELVQQGKFDPTEGDKIVLNYQADNQQYQNGIVAEVEDHIAREEGWIDEEPLWRESLSEVPAGSYYKKFELT